MIFSLSIIFFASQKEIFEAWLDSKKHSLITGRKARIDNHEDSMFTTLDNYISGRNLKLTPYSYIKQEWRTQDFKNDQPSSIVELFFDELVPNVTKVLLIHDNLPEDGIQYKRRWIDCYFNPMEEYFLEQIKL